MPHKDYKTHLEYQHQYNLRRREKDREYRRANRDRINALRNARKRRWRQAGKPPTPKRPVRLLSKPKPGMIALWTRNWRTANPERTKAINRRAWHRRRARLLGAPNGNNGSTELFISAVRGKRFVNCYYCNKRVSGKSAHIDHIIALAKGGAHSIENLCATCPACNLSKGAKPIEDWMRLGQQILAL